MAPLEVAVAVVTLSGPEVLQAVLVGAMRRWDNVKAGRGPKAGLPDGDWSIDIEGAAAELAVAKSLGAYWHGFASDPFALPGDVGRVQVRSTTREDGCLIVQRADPDDAWFVLVVGRVPTFRLAGWLPGAEAKRPEWWRANAPHPAFFVPQHALEAP